MSGSLRLAQTLLDQDLVDDLRLMVFPNVLGAGKRLYVETRGRSRCGREQAARHTMTVIYRPADEEEHERWRSS